MKQPRKERRGEWVRIRIIHADARRTTPEAVCVPKTRTVVPVERIIPPNRFNFREDGPFQRTPWEESCHANQREVGWRLRGNGMLIMEGNAGRQRFACDHFREEELRTIQ
jgi:hypothetical protein